MAKWMDVGRQKDFPPGSQERVRVENMPVVIFNVGGEMRAVLDICPHAGLPVGDGELRGRVLTCPFHGYSFNIDNGRNIDFPNQEAPLRVFPLRVTPQGGLQIDLEPDKA